MTRVLVTGATGFIGSHCLEPLVRRGHDVHAVSATRDPIDVDGVTWYFADLLDERQATALVRRVEPTHLLHLAWFVIPGKLIGAVESVHWTAASLGLLRAFVETGGRRVVTAGSAYEYDWRYGFCTEDLTPTAPDTVYGSCKLALSELQRALCEATGVSGAWARVFFLYGPREHPDRLVSSVVRKVLAGTAADCSHGRQIRDYLHVRDVADALVHILDSDHEGPVNVASGIPVALREIVLSIGEKLGRPDLIRLGAIPARANDAPVVVGNASLLRERLAWEPRFDLDRGLDETISWWANQGSTAEVPR
jgi:nucleoside-diphosphate-sugar epimerase